MATKKKIALNKTQAREMFDALAEMIADEIGHDKLVEARKYLGEELMNYLGQDHFEFAEQAKNVQWRAGYMAAVGLVEDPNFEY